MAPLKRICLTGKTCSVGKVQKSLCYGQSELHSGELDVQGRKGRETCTSCCCAEFSINSRNQQIRSKTLSRTQTTGKTTGARGARGGAQHANWQQRLLHNRDCASNECGSHCGQPVRVMTETRMRTEVERSDVHMRTPYLEDPMGMSARRVHPEHKIRGATLRRELRTQVLSLPAPRDAKRE